MLIYMLATAASPDAIFRAGYIYDAPRRLALPLLKGGVPRQTVSGFTPTPAAELYVEARHNPHGKLKVQKVPVRPDPQDMEREEMEEVEEFLGDADE